MGRTFLEHINGMKLYSCRFCKASLTNRSELISTRFSGATGRAYLFNRVVNLKYGAARDRVLSTGRHIVREANCKNCSMKLGWMYEFAFNGDQKYKEGRVVLEYELLSESEGFEDPFE